jgi:hypothetical protein
VAATAAEALDGIVLVTVTEAGTYTIEFVTGTGGATRVDARALKQGT